MAKIYLATSPDSVLVESMFSTAGKMLSSTRSSMAPYKVHMMLFIHDNYDVVCWLLTSTADQQFFNLLFM